MMVSSNDLSYIKRQLSLGEFVLFTGAGFSSACSTAGVTKVPTGRKLREVLWPHAFPGDEFEDTETLGDIFEVALRQDPKGLKRTLHHALTIDSQHVPAWYRNYIRGPWHRIYTLNFDNFWDLAPQLDPECRLLTPVSALSDETLPPETTAAVVHLNGRLSDFPNVTFSARQYGERQAGVDKWYVQLVSDLYGHPIIFVGTELNEPPLWEYLALRRQKSARSGERRPRSFLVAPTIGSAKRQILTDLNIVFVPYDAEQFANEVIAPQDDECRAGRALLQRRRTASRSDRVIDDVALLKAAASPPRYDAADFLLGRQPLWKDIESGYAIERIFDRELADAIESRASRLILVTGTAGAGKSTSLMRAASNLHRDGRRVLWFDGKDETELHLWQLRNRVRDAAAEFLFVDDADTFGSASGQFLTDAARENPDLIIVAGARANRLRSTGLEADEGFDGVELTVPGLADADIDQLIDALDAANRLGYLKGKERDVQRTIFQKSFDRQLIVAMVQATSGERFDRLIKGECSELQGAAHEIYAMTCLVTSINGGLKREEIILALSDEPGTAVAELQRLLDRRLLVLDSRGLIRARHRVVAEHAIDEVKSGGHFGRTIEGLVYALATKIGPEHDTRSREHRLLVTLINHQFLIEELQDPQLIRPIFGQIEEILNWDFHYWLQRGSFEVERGSINYAENFLAQAKSLAPDNLFVKTEWAYMLMVQAVGEAKAGLPLHRRHADAALDLLFDVIEIHGARTPYPFHVLARQGLEWTSIADLPAIEKTKYLGRILAATREGVKKHPGSRELRTIEKSVEKAYLLTST